MVETVDKKQLRSYLIEKRRRTSTNIMLKNSKKISDNLLSHSEFNEAIHVLFYVSTKEEVLTHSMIKKTLSLPKMVYVPLSRTKTHTLLISELNQFSDLIPGTYGILEPRKEKIKPVPLERLDLSIVPGVGFDEKGHRIGQGGGYYDWLLSHTNATSIGLSFEFQIQDTIPTEPHDQRVDFIITEKRVISCKT